MGTPNHIFSRFSINVPYICLGVRARRLRTCEISGCHSNSTEAVFKRRSPKPGCMG